MATRPKVTRQFVASIEEGLRAAGEDTAQKLDFLLPRYRGMQSLATSSQAKLKYLEPIITDLLLELEGSSKGEEYVTTSKRTMGMLVYQPKPITGEGAQSRARRIRRHVANVLGGSAARRAVVVSRSVSYKINWDLVASGGAALLETIRGVTGIRPKPTLLVRETSQRAKLGKIRKGR